MGETDQRQHDDEELILRIMDQDRDALREFVVRFDPKALLYLQKKLGQVLDDHDLNEALNIAAYKVWRNAHRYQAEVASLGTWYTRIAYRAAQDILKKEGRRRYDSLPEDLAENLEAELRDDHDSPTRPNVAALLDAIDKVLTPAEREIVRYDLASPSDKADDTFLAEVTGKSKSTIQVLRSKARRKLREALTAKGIKPSTGKGGT